MGIGVVVRDIQGDWISGMSNNYSQGSVFKAELLAIESGLHHVWDLQKKDIVCYTDFLQAVQVITTMMEVSSYWEREIIIRIRTMLSWNWKLMLRHIHRDRNFVADALVRDASLVDYSIRLWTTPPSAVVALLCKDALA